MENSLSIYYGYPVMEAWREELYHHGVKGMRWGVRRTPQQLGHKVAKAVRKAKEDEAAYRKKLTNITKNKRADPNDIKRFEYRNQSLAKRAGKTAAKVTAQMLIADMLTGKINNYGSMSKVELAKRLGTIAKTTAVNVAVQDALAKSASKRYTDSGKKVKGTKDHLIQKEDWIETGISTAVRVAPLLNVALHLKMSQVNRERQQREDEFNRWAGNILTEKVDNILWTSDDRRTQVIG